MIRLKKLMLTALAAVSMLTMTAVPSYVVNAANEVSGTKENAVAMEAGKAYSGTIGSSNNYESWYEIKAVDYTNYYQFTFKVGSVNNGISFSVVNSDGETLCDEMVNSSAYSKNVNVKFSPNETYYLKVYGNRSFYGDYNVSYKVNKDVADDKSDAGYIMADSTVKESICTVKDVDWYRIKTVNYTNYYEFKFSSVSTNGYLSYSVVDSDGMNLYSEVINNQNSKTVKLKLEPGKSYYVKVGSSGYGYTGEYNIKFSVHEDVADSKEDAKEINVGDTISDSICVSSDCDWYKIKAVDYTNYYQFNFITDNTVSGCLYFKIITEDGEQITGTNLYGSKNTTVNAKFEPGKYYYIKVDGDNYNSGNYKLSAKVYGDVADTKDQAKQIYAGQKVSENISATGDVDWYMYRADYDQNFTISMINEDYGGGMYYTVYNEDGEKVISSLAYGSGNKDTRSNVLYAGNYYIKIYLSSSETTRAYAYNFTVSNTAVETCLKPDNNGVWRYYINGKQDNSKTGLVYDNNVGWWYVEDGKVNFNYNDLYYDTVLGWWKVSGGAVDFGYNDLYYSPTLGWWKVSGGQVDFGYNDLYYSSTLGWWKVNGGAVDFGYNDLYYSSTLGWWKVSGGAVDFGYNDLYYSPTCGWWKVSGGAVDFGYTDLYYSPTYGWWKINGGAVDFDYNGMYNSPTYGSWKIAGGSVVFN